jgi:hypothetical protein
MTIRRTETTERNPVNRERRTKIGERRSLIVLHSFCASLIRWPLLSCVAVLGMLLLVPSGRLCAQKSGGGTGQSGSSAPSANTSGSTPVDPFALESRSSIAPTGNSQGQLKLIEALKADQHKALVSNSEKLLKLTAELNAQINGAHPAGLTASQLHMVEEIAKLAHNISEKMSTPITAPLTSYPEGQPTAVF